MWTGPFIGLSRSLQGRRARRYDVWLSLAQHRVFGPDDQKHVDELLSLFGVGTASTGAFTCCGLETRQCDDFNICVVARGSTENIRSISDPKGALPASGEIGQMMSVDRPVA